MDNKNIGLILITMYALGAMYEFISVVLRDNVKINIIVTIAMLSLFVLGIYFLTKNEK